jgi:hypothetical protein
MRGQPGVCSAPLTPTSRRAKLDADTEQDG